MTFTYGSNTVHICTDDGGVQIVVALEKKDGLRFKTAMHTGDGQKVETFTAARGTLRVFIRKGDGVRILQEDVRYPETPSEKWNRAVDTTTYPREEGDELQ